VQPFSVGTNTWNWTTDTKPGSYRVVVWANQTGHQTSTYEGFASATATVTGCGAATAAWNPASPQPSGTNPITLTGGTSGCATPQVEIWMLAPGASSWTDVKPYATAGNVFTWNTTNAVHGTYNFSVWAKDAASSGASGNSLGSWDNYVATTYILTSVTCTSESVTTMPPNTAPLGYQRLRQPVHVPALRVLDAGSGHQHLGRRSAVQQQPHVQLGHDDRR
jgi:hypothetical protein